MKNKKAAIELSIGTVVIIVLAMTMLIMGVVLVRNIFSGATSSVDTLNDKVKGEITSLFSEEGSKIAVRLGADKLAKIKQGDKVGIGIGGKTEPAPGAPTASASTRRLTFALEKTSSVECIGLSIEGFQFNQNGNKWTTPSSFDDEEGPDGMSILFFEAAEDAPPCTQKYKIHTYDMDHTGSNEIASASFRVQIISGGIFSN